MKNFNLSRWALDHKSLVVYFMLAIAVAGLLDYFKLDQVDWLGASCGGYMVLRAAAFDRGGNERRSDFL